MPPVSRPIDACKTLSIVGDSSLHPPTFSVPAAAVFGMKPCPFQNSGGYERPGCIIEIGEGLAHDLRPKMKGFADFFPLPVRQFGPRVAGDHNFAPAQITP